jgi:Tol biopolymer transport system component
MTRRIPLILIAAVLLTATATLQAQTDQTELVELQEGTNLMLALSPDKSTLVIDLLGQLWLMPAQGGAAQTLTPSNEEARAPRFHPNGEDIIYQGYAGGSWDIWNVNIATSRRRQLTEGRYDDREPDIHPAGTHLAFASDRSGSSQIWELNLATGALSQLTWEAQPSAYPSYSADGSSLAYVTGNSRNSQLRVHTRANRATITVYTASGWLFAPSWRPGNGVITTGIKRGLTTELRMLLLGPDGVNKPLTEAEDVFPSRVAWLNADEFLYTADGRIWRRHLDPFRRKPVPLFAAVSVTRPGYVRKHRSLDGQSPHRVLGIRSPRVSAAGDKVVFTALGDLWLLDRKGRTTQLTDDPYVDIDPLLYDDGNKVLFASDREGSMQLWSMSLDGSNSRRLTALTGATYFPALSPDGTQVAFLETRGRNVWGPVTLQVLSLQDSRITTLAPTLFSPGRPSWLSNRRLIVPTLAGLSNRFREGTNHIIQFDVESNEQEPFPFAEAIEVGTRINHGPEAARNGARIAAATTAGLKLYDLVPQPTPPPEVPGIGSVAPSFDTQGRLTYLDVDGLQTLDATTGEQKTWPLGLQWKAPGRDDELVIQAGRVFDGTGTTYRRHLDIHIRGQRIVAVVPRGSLPYPQRVIDARDQTVVPGLIDMHVHQSAVWGEKLGRLWLAFGVTSVREPGADPYDALERRESWDSGKRLGPRLFFAGELLDGDRVYYGQSSPTPSIEQIDAQVERAGRLDYDWLKTYVRLPHALQQRVISQAHERGIPVASHEVFPAALFGADAVEHLGATSRRSFNPKVSMGNETYEDVIGILAGSNMTFTPTLALLGGMAALANRNPSLLQDPTYLSFYPTTNQQAVRAVLGFFGNRQDLDQHNQLLGATIAQITRRGGRVVTGTDAPFVPYGLGLHAELITLQNAGLPADQVLRMATSQAALALGYSQDLGTIETGRLADLIVIDGDPLMNLSHLRSNLAAVVKGGVWLDRRQLIGSVDEVYGTEKN